jgi:hypothetical protein
MNRGGHGPGAFLLVLLFSIAAAGFVTSVVATIAALRGATLAALRSE